MRVAWGHYQQSPFVVVSCRLQFPPVLTISRELPVSFQERMRNDFPLFQPTQDRRGYRLGSQDAAHEIVLQADSLVLSTRRYDDWLEFQTRISAAIEALQACYQPAFCARATLRYQGLIRPVLYGLTQIQWPALINAKVLGPFSLPGQKGHLQGSRHEVVVSLPQSSHRFRLTHGFVEVREAGHTNGSGEPAYLLDQDYFTTQQLEWSSLMTTLEQFEQEAGQFFRLCVSDRLHQAMVPKAA
ncbi:MAG: TIGR04255 family protein [Nitrospira sp.]|nr:TIGR04255 family protein [Nitrospira sp.]